MKILAATSFALLAVFGSPAHAGDGKSWRVGNDSYHIYFNDLDLKTRQGRTAMLLRAESAAAKLCQTRPTAIERRACVSETMEATALSAQGGLLKLALEERRGILSAAR